MSKKPKYLPPAHAYFGPLASTNSGRMKKQVFSGIYASQIQSVAFRALTDKQKVLFLYMRMQEHAEEKPSGFGENCFYFPRALWSKTLGLYQKDTRYYTDLDALIEAGFVDCIASGYTTREKSVYRFSERWKEYGTDTYEVPASARRMKRKRREE